MYMIALQPQVKRLSKLGGANGAKSIAYKIVKKKGKVISKTVLSEDNYNPMKKVVKTGTLKNMEKDKNN